MNKLILFLLLITGTANAQTSTINGIVYYTKAGADAAIKAAIAAQAKVQANTDALKDARFTKIEARLNDTVFFDKKFLPVIGKTVTFSLDSLAKYFKVPAPVVDLTSINNSIATLNTSVTSLNIRVTSLEQWRTVAQGSLDKINTTISLLPPIPTKAVSVSTSTTTTTTTTTLQ